MLTWTTAATAWPSGGDAVGAEQILAPPATSTAKIPFHTPARGAHPWISKAVAAVLNVAEVRERFVAAGLEPVGSSPDQLAAIVKSEMLKWGKVIRALNIKAD